MINHTVRFQKWKLMFAGLSYVLKAATAKDPALQQTYRNLAAHALECFQVPR